MEGKWKYQQIISGLHKLKPGIILPSDDIYNAIYKAGIKEVVEWVNNHSSKEVCEYANNQIQQRFNVVEWQAKLREWEC